MAESQQVAMSREWSHLPELPLAIIAQLLLPSLRDLFAFASICRSWRTLLRSLSPSLLPSLPPLLLRLSSPLLSPSSPPLPFPSSPLPPLVRNGDEHLRSKNVTPLLPSSPYLCLSFSHGHLLLLPSSLPLQPFLADVITGSRILLPPLPPDRHRIPYYYATLTAPPSSPSSLFLLFFSKFSFLSCPVSSPDATWTHHHFSPHISYITHVAPFRSRLFGINDHARLLEIDPSDQARSVRISDVRGPPRMPHDFDRWHFGPQLVGAPNELLLVLFLFHRETSTASSASFRFSLPTHVTKIEIYSLDWRRMEWVEVERLRDRAIFIDCAGKAPVLCEKPERWGGKSNCVYVAGPGCQRWRRFSLDEMTVTPMPPLCTPAFTGPRWPSPIWINPSLFY